MSKLSDIEIKHERRGCIVDERPGYFHCWSHEANVIEPGIAIGSHPGGQFSTTLGIVEFSDGVKKVAPEKIKFVDEENMMLDMMEANNKYTKAVKEATDG